MARPCGAAEIIAITGLTLPSKTRKSRAMP